MECLKCGCAKQLKFSIHLILIKLNLSSHLCLVATVLDRADINYTYVWLSFFFYFSAGYLSRMNKTFMLCYTIFIFQAKEVIWFSQKFFLYFQSSVKGSARCVEPKSIVLWHKGDEMAWGKMVGWGISNLFIYGAWNTVFKFQSWHWSICIYHERRGNPLRKKKNRDFLVGPGTRLLYDIFLVSILYSLWL